MVDMFLEVAGVKGESKDKVHRDEIDVLAWSWGMTQSGTTHTGGGGAGKVDVQDLVITKYVDRSSPALMLATAQGKHFSKVELVVRTEGDKPAEFIKITMENVMVTSVLTGGTGSQSRLTEKITLDFSKVKFAYSTIDRTGKAVPAGEMSWDIAKNQQAAPPPQFFEALANAGADVDGTGITFVAHAGVNISDLPLVQSFTDASIADVTETGFTLNLGNNVAFRVTGSFVLEDGKTVSGKVDTADYFHKGKVLYSLSSLDLTLEELAKFETDVGAGLRYVFAGDDTITGSAKRDSLAGFSGDDTIKGGGGDDRVSGGNDDDALFGGHGRDTVDGGRGDDTLSGGRETDLLKGGLGDDTFLFENTPRTASGYDRILDFKVADDEIALDKDIFRALGSSLNASEFHVVKKMSAVEADDRVIYDASTGLLYYDVDGSGVAKAQIIARLNPKLALSINNFDIV